MALRFRRGTFAEFVSYFSRLLPGEPALVLSGDPSTQSGKGFYVCVGQGAVERFVTSDEVATQSMGGLMSAEDKAALDKAVTDTRIHLQAVTVGGVERIAIVDEREE